MTTFLKLLLAAVPFFCIVSACTTTQIQKDQYCIVCLQKQDTIIVDIFIPNLNQKQNDYLNSVVMREFKKEGFLHVYHWYDLDYDLLVNGIKEVRTVEDLRKTHEKLGIKYVVDSDLERYVEREADSDYVLDSDLYSSDPHMPIPITDESTIKLYFVEAATNTPVSQLTVMTKSVEYNWSDDEGGTSHETYASAWETLYDGTSRGARFIVADCQCPKGRYAKRRRSKK